MSDDSSSSEDEDYQDVVRACHVIFHMAMTGCPKSVQKLSKKINYAAVKFGADVQVAVAPPAPLLAKSRKLLKQSIGVGNDPLTA